MTIVRHKLRAVSLRRRSDKALTILPALGSFTFLHQTFHKLTHFAHLLVDAVHLLAQILNFSLQIVASTLLLPAGAGFAKLTICCLQLLLEFTQLSTMHACFIAFGFPLFVQFTKHEFYFLQSRLKVFSPYHELLAVNLGAWLHRVLHSRPRAFKKIRLTLDPLHLLVYLIQLHSKLLSFFRIIVSELLKSALELMCPFLKLTPAYITHCSLFSRRTNFTLYLRHCLVDRTKFGMKFIRPLGILASEFFKFKLYLSSSIS